jgi:hypothetical protein
MTRARPRVLVAKPAHARERELREIAGRVGYDIVKVYKDHGISGAKGRRSGPHSTRSAATLPSASLTW